jgi:hypothetical protein
MENFIRLSDFATPLSYQRDSLRDDSLHPSVVVDPMHHKVVPAIRMTLLHPTFSIEHAVNFDSLQLPLSISDAFKQDSKAILFALKAMLGIGYSPNDTVSSPRSASDSLTICQWPGKAYRRPPSAYTLKCGITRI